MKRFWLVLTVLFFVSFSRAFAGEATVDDILKSLSNENNACQIQKGYASWYGLSDSLMQTANGNVYNSDEIFAASKTLPFGSKVLVKNLYNGKELFVKIVDRGPYVKGRILDLSRGAAKELGMINAGVVPIKIYTLGCEYALNKLKDMNFYSDSTVTSTASNSTSQN
ncbi:MAG: septal ring lytic transglycosylase RlpA family protein [Desulfurella sp.]|uniref:septal ring lytic transglycosylase RlpA family protein n=1 Tax=Desulfurella sp. TaxID=1962857 RepID=UPI0004B88A5A